MRASGSDRAISCPQSLVLPVLETENEKRDRAAAFGTLCHHWAQTGEHDPEWGDPRDIACLAKKLELSGIKRDMWWPPEHGKHEEAFAIVLETRKLIVRSEMAGESREAPDLWKKAFVDTKHQHYLTGSIDWLFYGDDEHLPWVCDLKTGNWPIDPAESKQLRSYALVPWIKAGCPLKWECAVSICTWKKYPQAGLPTREGARLTGLDLYEHWDALLWSINHPEEANPSEDACRFCNSKTFCDAYAAQQGNEN